MIRDRSFFLSDACTFCCITPLRLKSTPTHRLHPKYVPMSSQHQRCSRCAEPASFTCSHCEDTPMITQDQPEPSTWYCTITCQTLDKLAHNAHCKRLCARKSLYRAGRILLELFLQYAETRFMFPVVSVHRRGGRLHVAMREQVMLENRCNHLSMLDNLDPSISTKERSAILCAYNCHAAAAWMHNMIAFLLTGRSLDNINQRNIDKK